MSKKTSSISAVDLVIVIDTSPSMKDEAQALSDAAASAIAKAKSSCPSDLRVVWLGIEGIWNRTNFNQTLRAYLTQKCKVAESKLRGRKRGELESAGAQEDAARAIEDISDYFDWRSGATRAIFYLGDEALEGGGDKTEQKDIQAANKAIQKAQGAGVIVHTYFGTSKSKHLEGIKTEYARVATSTGGQSFTNQDALGGFSAVLEKVICGSRTAEPASTTVITQITQITPEVNSESKSSQTKSQEIKAVKEESMSILTIDTKNNCYVIDPQRMNNLQQNVATTFTFDKGTFDIRITGGRYSYSKSKTEGEPFVLLWIYGIDGSTFINKTTGYEVGATWTTLNGYNDNLQLEVKGRAVLNALFFDFNNNENSGSIELLITSNKPFFNPHTLTVDSKRNCYVLDENSLSSLKQSGANSTELNPGNYRLKIQEGSASYWSDNKKFNIEPWALIWASGKFTTKLTDIEVEKTWLSLNGLKDEVVLEVKEKTTLSGFFFDTHKDDNSGQIIVAIEPVSATELAQKKKQKATTTEIQQQGQTTTTKTVVNQGQTTTTKTVTNIGGTGTSVTNIEGGGGSVSREAVGASSSTQFSFRFNEEEFKKKWEEQLQQINASIKVVDQEDVTLEAKYWDQLEQWLLKNYEKHFKNLAIEVAKVRFSMDAYIQQMEFSLNQHLQSWSGYLDKLLEDRINVEISQRINQLVNARIDQTFEQKISNNIELIINNIVNKQELNQYIDRHVDRLLDSSFEQKIRNNVGLIINNIVNKQELNQHINQHVDRHLDDSFEEKIRSNINVITQRLVNDNTALNQYVSQQIDSTYEQKIQNNIQALTQNIVQDEQLNRYIDQRLQQSISNNSEINNSIVNTVVNSPEINNKINNESNRTFITLATQHADELINTIGGTETFNRAITQNIVNNNAALDQYVSQQIDNSYEQKIQNNIQALTQNFVNNNEELNRYIDQRFQQSVTDNTEINNSIVNVVANSNEINNKIDNLRSEWNRTFINLASQQVDELINVISGSNTFNRAITQNIVNNNEELNRYIDQRFQQSVTNNTEINNSIVNVVANSNEINNKIENLRNEWNQTFINLASQQVDQLIDVISGSETFNRAITQKIVNNNQELNQYIDQRFQQSVTNNTEINTSIVNLVSNSNEINNKIENLRNEWNRTFINQASQQVDELINVISGSQTFNRTITQKIVNNNQELNQYIDQRFQQSVTNNTEINNSIVNVVANSTEINNKINNVYRDIDLKIDNVRNEWNRAFINLVTQNVDQLINIIGGTEAFNIQVANIINIKVDELLNQILRTKNELTVIINNADRHLYEWTLGELMAIKGCLTDRQVLVEQLVTFSAELRTKLDSTNCVDINTFKPFKPISNPQQLSPVQQGQLPGS